jgi:transcriptional regulator with XRE-family HTH domain
MATPKRSGSHNGRARRPKAAHSEFGARLAAYRAAASLTQSQLAERLGVSRRQIAYYESGNGRPPGALLGLLADLFQVSTDVLLGREASKAPASRLSSTVLARLRRIERMGADVARRFESTLEQFILEEGWRRSPTRAHKATANSRTRGARAAARR